MGSNPLMDFDSILNGFLEDPLPIQPQGFWPVGNPMSISPDLGNHQSLPPASSFFPFDILNPSPDTASVEPFQPNLASCQRQQQKSTASTTIPNNFQRQGYQQSSPTTSSSPFSFLGTQTTASGSTHPSHGRNFYDIRYAGLESLSWLPADSGPAAPLPSAVNNPGSCLGAAQFGDDFAQQPGFANSSPSQRPAPASFQDQTSSAQQGVQQSQDFNFSTSSMTRRNDSHISGFSVSGPEQSLPTNFVSNDIPAFSNHPEPSNSTATATATTTTTHTPNFLDIVISPHNSSTAGGLFLPQPNTTATTSTMPPRGSTSAGSTTVSTRSTGRKRDSGVAGLDSFDTPKKMRTVAGSTRTGGSNTASMDSIWDDDSESDDDPDIIDLRGDTLPDFVQEKKKKGERIRLGQFQCAICMDYATGLTVTHCGHLFCGECLTSALAIENQKNKCPICRQKIEHKPNTKNNKGYYPLELKLMTSARKGKRADGASKR